MRLSKNLNFSFDIRGDALILIDWANIHSGLRKNKLEMKTSELARYCRSIAPKNTHFYFGTDDHPKSQAFVAECQTLDWNVITKPVKYINGRRKCDFDVEITMTALLAQQNYETLILMSGDGDYAALYEYLLKQGKRVFVVYTRKTVGKEVILLEQNNQGNKSILVNIKRLSITKNSPS